MENAFVLGAGLGTRLRPLTDDLPKPLVPVGGRPLVTYLFDKLIDAGAKRILLNTHHLPGAYAAAFPAGHYREIPLTFRYEELLLDSGGGLANSLNLLSASNDSTLIANGDVLTDISLTAARETHARASHPSQGTPAIATLVLRSSGRKRNVALHPASGLITDIRGQLGSPLEAQHQFTGFYFVEPRFFDLLSEYYSRSLSVAGANPFSIIPLFLDLAAAGQLAGHVEDSGTWQDLTDPDSYIRAHQTLFPKGYISPEAIIGEGCQIGGTSYIGGGCDIGEGSVIANSVLWPGAVVPPGARLAECVVRTGRQSGKRGTSFVY